MNEEHPKVALVKAVDRFLKVLQKENSGMTITGIRTLIFLKSHQGGDPHWDIEAASEQNYPLPPSITELSEAIGVSQPTMTRIIKMLGDGDDSIGTGKPLGLVETIRHPQEHRKRLPCLTRKGSLLIEDIFDGLEDSFIRMAAQKAKKGNL